MSKLAERVKVALDVLRNFPRGCNVDILLIFFRLLTLQCKRTFTKRFTVSTPQRKCPTKARAPFASILKSFSSGAVGYTNLPQRCTFCHLLQLSLIWGINVVIIANSTQLNRIGLELSTTTFAALSIVCAGWTELTSEIFFPNCFLLFGYQKCFFFRKLPAVHFC